jgi:hypothetical protein
MLTFNERLSNSTLAKTLPSRRPILFGMRGLSARRLRHFGKLSCRHLQARPVLSDDVEGEVKLYRCHCGNIWIVCRKKRSLCCDLPMMPVDEASLREESE